MLQLISANLAASKVNTQSSKSPSKTDVSKVRHKRQNPPSQALDPSSTFNAVAAVLRQYRSTQTTPYKASKFHTNFSKIQACHCLKNRRVHLSKHPTHSAPISPVHPKCPSTYPLRFCLSSPFPIHLLSLLFSLCNLLYKRGLYYKRSFHKTHVP